MAKLVAMLPGGRRKTFPLSQPRLILGRSESADIPLPAEPKASREHLRIDFVAGVITVEDLNSSNGTWYDGERVTHRQIRDRDILQIGATRLQFLYDDEGKPDPPKGRKRRNLATLDRDVVYQQDGGGFVPAEQPVPYVEVLDGEERGLMIGLAANVTVGRAAQCELLLDHKKLSQTHSQFGQLGDDCFVTDLGSTNGTYVNRQRLAPQQPRRLIDGDIVEVGDIRIAFRVPPELRGRAAEAAAASGSASADVNLSALARHSLTVRTGPRAGERLHLTAKTTFGRDPYNQVVVDGKLASRFHAEIVLAAGRFSLRDHNSANGTYVNGRRLTAGKAVPLKHGDVVQVGDFIFSFEEAGADLALDERVADIRRRANVKVASTLFLGLLFMAAALGVVFVLTDKVVEAVLPDEVPALVGKSTQSSLPALSFEPDLDGNAPDPVPGWLVSARGSNIELQLESADEHVIGGLTSLRISAKQPRSNTRVRLRTSPAISRALAASVRGESLRVRVHARMPAPAGLVGLRAVYVGPDLPSDGLPVTLGWFEGAELPAGQWFELDGHASLPTSQLTELHIELLVLGAVSSVYFDEMRVETQPGTPLVPTALPSAGPLSIQFARGTTARGTADPTRQVVVQGETSRMVDPAELVLVRRAANDEDGAARFAAVGAAGARSVARVEQATLAALDVRMPLLDVPRSRVVGAQWRTARDADSYVWTVALDEASAIGDSKLAADESLALRLSLTSRLSNRGLNHLTLYNAAGDAVRLPTRAGGQVEGVVEATWGTADGRHELSVAFERPTPVIVEQTRAGEVTVLPLLVRGSSQARAATVTLRPYSASRARAARALIAQAREYMADDGTHLGEAVLLLRAGLRRYDGVLDFGSQLRAMLEGLDRQWRTAYETIRISIAELEQTSLTTPGQASVYARTVNDGLAACETFLTSFRAMVDEARQVELWRQELGEYRARVDELLAQANRTQRMAEAGRLMDKARRFADITRVAEPLNLDRNFRSPNCSTVLAMAYLDEVIQSYPDLEGTLREATQLRDAIRSLWEHERLNPEIVPAALREARAAASSEDAAGYLEAAAILRRTLNRWPHSVHRLDVLAHWHYYAAESDMARGALIGNPQAHVASARRHLRNSLALLPHTGDESDGEAEAQRRALREAVEARLAALAE